MAQSFTITFYPAPDGPRYGFTAEGWGPRCVGQAHADLHETVAEWFDAGQDDITTDDIVFGVDGYAELVFVRGRPVGSLNAQLTPSEWQDAFAALAQPRIFNAA
jgi:hypothetical protein